MDISPTPSPHHPSSMTTIKSAPSSSSSLSSLSSSPSHSTIPAMEIPDSLQRSHHTYVEDDESDDYHLQENVGTDLDGDGVIVSLAHIQVR